MTSLTAIVVAISMAIVGQDTRPGLVLRGRVLHSDLPVPGATVTAIKENRTIATTSDVEGSFRFEKLEAGNWKITVEMRGFAAVARDVTIPPDEPERSS
jgi:uncharacterized GH25 family protein